MKTSSTANKLGTTRSTATVRRQYSSLPLRLRTFKISSNKDMLITKKSKSFTEKWLRDTTRKEEKSTAKCNK